MNIWSLIIICRLDKVITCLVFSQETVYPALPQTQTTVLYNGTLHKGNGEVIENAVVIMEKGKITYAGPMVASDFKDAKVIDVKGKHIYPDFPISKQQPKFIKRNELEPAWISPVMAPFGSLCKY